MSIQICVRLEKRPGDDVDLDVLLAQHRVARGEQEHRREQVPLDLEVGVRAGVERLADDRVERADQHGGEDQPRDPAADRIRCMRSISRERVSRGATELSVESRNGRLGASRPREAPPILCEATAARTGRVFTARRARRADRARSRRSAAAARRWNELARARAGAAERQDRLRQRRRAAAAKRAISSGVCTLGATGSMRTRDRRRAPRPRCSRWSAGRRRLRSRAGC